MNIRLSGFSHEIDQFLSILSKVPGITVARESKDYSDRNSQYVRRYIDIEFTLDNNCPKFPLEGGNP